jgi:dUTP pyrophosphatase
MKVKLLTDTAITPTKGSKGAAGFDLFADMSCVIKPGNRHAIKTGIAIKAPECCYLRIAPRSGMAARYGADTLAGVIDADYTGEICVILQNNGCRDITITAGARIAQIIPEKIWYGDIELVSVLGKTGRGGDGFGSTGS